MINIGDKFGKWTIISEDNKIGKKYYYLCKCDCGTIKSVKGESLKAATSKSCGCYVKEAAKNRSEDLTGQVFGKLTIISMGDRYKYGGYYWNCSCDCGNTIKVSSRSLKIGHTKSCGCLHKESLSLKRLPDNLTIKNEIYQTYKSRADKKNIEFSLDFTSFVNIIESNCNYCDKPPSNQFKSSILYSNYKYNGIDRINNDLGYIKGNVTPCCKRCNYAKNDMNIKEFKDWVNDIYNNFIIK